MVVYLSLQIMPNKINPDEWRETYEESLALLLAFPDEIMGIQHEKIYSSERRVYSRKIEHNVDDPKERHWHVVGDFKSKQRGESFIFYYESLRDVMKVFRKPEGMIDTVNIQFGSALMDMGGFKGRNMHFYMDEKQVLKILCQLFPAFARQIKDVFTKGTEKIKKELADSREGVNEFIRKYEAQPEIGDGESFMHLESAEKLSELQKTMLEFLAYALAQTRSRILEEYPAISKDPPEQLKEKIVGISSEQGLTFTEDAWKWIDSEKDVDLLHLVLALVMITNRELTFSNLRRGILENRELCNAVLEMTQDGDLLAGIAEKVNALKEGA